MGTLYSEVIYAYHKVPTQVWVLMYSLWLVTSVAFIVMQRRSPTATLAWMIGFFSLPVVGAIMYFFFGPRRLKRRRLRRDLAKHHVVRHMEQSTADPVYENQDDSFDASDTGYLDAVALGRHCGTPTRASYLELYDNGDATFEAIESAMRSAKDHIHLEYYIFEPDAVGTRWLNLLCDCARRGVTVRVLLDALGSMNANEAFWQPLQDAGGMLRYFNAPRFFTPKVSKLNFRTHRKIVIVDGRTGFTGGINIEERNSAYYCGADAWRDTHMRIDGAPVQELQYLFLEDWQYANESARIGIGKRSSTNALPANLKQCFPPLEPTSGPWVQIVGSGPDTLTPEIHHLFFRALTLARRRIWLTTPYFVPDEAILTAIVTAVHRGVDVQIIIPSEGDSKLVAAAASTYAAEAHSAGAKVWTYGPAMNHAKTMVIDDTLAIVGTANLDNRSFRLNFEVVAAVYDKSLTRELADLFETDLHHCTDFADRQSGFFEQLLASAARLFAPIL